MIRRLSLWAALLCAGPAPLTAAVLSGAAAPVRLILPGQPAPATGPIIALPPRLVDLSREGQAVYAHVVTAQAALEQDRGLAAPLAALRSAVAEAKPALVESVRLGEWRGPNTTLSDSCCGDAAPKLALLLQRMGLPAEAVEAEFHYYALWRHEAGDLFLDPSIRQFFGKQAAPAAVPEVFVGTQGDLHRLYRDYAAHRTKSYDYTRIYFSDSATRNAAVAKLEGQLEQRSDLQTLARFLKARLLRR